MALIWTDRSSELSSPFIQSEHLYHFVANSVINLLASNARTDFKK